MIETSRRHFLKTTVAMFALVAGGEFILHPLRQAWASSPSSGQEFWLMCDTADLKDPTQFPQVTNPGSVKAFNVASGEVAAVDVPFFGHIVIQNPVNPYQVVTFEKWGTRGALVDLKEKSILASAEAIAGHYFFGHSSFIADGHLITTEDSYTRDKGQLGLRDASTLKLVDKLSSYGSRPHDCRAINDGKVLMVVNEGRDSSNIAWIEVASGKLLHNVVFSFETHPGIAHMDVAPDGWICASGFHPPRKGTKNFRVAFVSPDGVVFIPKVPPDMWEKLNGEGLSIHFMGDSGLIAVTLPASNLVAVFDYKTQELVNTVEIARPTGLLFDTSSSAADPAMIVCSSQNRTIERASSFGSQKVPAIKSIAPGFGGVGRHMSRIYI